MVMLTKVWLAKLILVLVLWCIISSRVSSSGTCSIKTVTEVILGFRDVFCPVDGHAYMGDYMYLMGIVEGDEISLQKALTSLHKHHYEYIAVLFYASWCPFSKMFRPTFSMLSSLYPSIPHMAIEKDVIRPSILSKFGVHGFPTLFLLNSTMRVRYHGSRKFESLVSFYHDVSGLETESLEGTSLGKIKYATNRDTHNNSEHEACPFSWARSPENLLRQETYLALATGFVLLRLFYAIFSKLVLFMQRICTRRVQNTSLWERPFAYLYRRVQILNTLKEPCKRSNLRGAMSARSWASKSLASVSIGDSSSSRSSSILTGQ